MHRKIFYFLLFLVLCPVLINAGTKGRIKGKVVDLQTGEALIGANVLIVGTSAGNNTDASGEFLIQNMDPGTYTLKCSYVGYQSITISNVRVNADITTFQNFELPSQDIQVGTVIITAQKPIIQKDNTNAVRITTGEDISALPVRGFNSFLTLTPGVSTNNNEIHLRGGRSDEVGYYVEGVSVRNPRGGGRAVSISQDAIEEMQVQSGGYTAEFGGANSGIVRSTFRSGGSQLKASVEYITDNVTFKSAKNAFDGKKTPFGTYWLGYDETSTSLSGPLFDQRIKFFVNLNYQFSRNGFDPSGFPNKIVDQPSINLGTIWDKNIDANKRDTVNFVFNNGPQPKAARKYYTVTGTMNFDFKPLIFRLSGSYFIDENNVNETGPYNIYNDRPGQNQEHNGTANLKMTHVLSPSLFYELNAGIVRTDRTQQDAYLLDNYWGYGDSVANAAVGYVWTRTPQDIARRVTGQFTIPRAYQVYEWNFARTGGVNVIYRKEETNSFSFAGALNWLPNKWHSIKLGGEYQNWTYRNYIPGTLRGRQDHLAQLYYNNTKNNPDNLTDAQIKTNILRNTGSVIYGYDYFGNKYDGTDDIFHAPHKPVFASAYLQDKIEYEDIILNIGLRYDYIDIDNLQMVDPTRPDYSINKADNILIATGWEKVPTFSAVSPRIGLSFPVTDKTVFHAQFGKFIQQPDLNESYVGYDYYAYQLTTGYFFQDMRGPGLRPTRTTQYELGFSQQIADFMSFDITAYYKDIKDLVQMVPAPVDIASGYGNYYLRQNVDFATTKGVEIAVNMRRYQRLQLNGSMSFQDARGTGSYPNSSRGIVGAPVVAGQPYTPKNISPLEFDRPFMSNLSVDYRFGDNDGPTVLNNFGVNLLMTYQSGRPFTRAIGNPASVGISQVNSGDSRFRTPVEPLGSSQMPDYFNLDLKVDKSFSLFDKLRATVYVTVLNLLNTKNVTEVYLLTGTNTDDGYLSNPTTLQQRLATDGQTYVDIYQLNIARNGLWSGMRQIRLGIRLDY